MIGKNGKRTGCRRTKADVVGATRQDAEALTEIQGAFPGNDQCIERIFKNNGSFRELCEDHRNCAAALQRWQKSEVPTAAARRQEYAELLLELGQEVQGWLDAAETDQPAVRGADETPGPDRGTAK